MRWLTILGEDAVLNALQAIARRRGVPLAEVTREALAAYVDRQQPRRTPLTLAGIGRSGRRDIAGRAEEFFKGGLRGPAINRRHH